jgi:hypothetical protein
MSKDTIASIIAIIALIIFFTAIALISGLKIAHADNAWWRCDAGNPVCVRIPMPEIHDADRDHENSIESHSHRWPAVIEQHNDEDED